MSVVSPHELAAKMALAACQINAFEPFTTDLPPLSWLTAEHEGAFDLHGYVSGYRKPDGEYVTLTAEDEIDALRTWAAALGADLHLTEVHTGDQYETLRIEIRAELESGLKVLISAHPYYPRQTAQPAPEAALATA